MSQHQVHILKAIGLLLILAQVCAAAEQSNSIHAAHPHATGRVLVKVKGSKATFQTRPIRKGESLEEAITRLEAQSDIEYAEPDWLVTGQQTQPNDPKFAEQWGLGNAKADCAWEKTKTVTQTVKVCVVDSGIQYDHPDLATHMDPTFKLGYNAITRTNRGMDDSGHGTHVAGIIAAVSNNGIGVAGLAPTASLIPCKFLNNNNQGYVSDALACIDYCHYTAGAKISSHSWGTTTVSSALSDKITEVTAAGHLIIAAAGNSGVDNDSKRNNPMYPASFTHAGIISVAAIESTDLLAGYSNYGATSVDLAAPGSSITSSHLGSTYSAGSGTSYSTPFVTGAAALLAAAKPGITSAQIKSTLISTARKLPSLTGKCVSGGTLDVCAAATLVLDETSPSPSLFSPPPTGSPPPAYSPPSPKANPPPPSSPSGSGSPNLGNPLNMPPPPPKARTVKPGK